MDNGVTSKRNYLVYTIVFIILMSIGGTITSLHLVDIHYREPGRTDYLLKRYKVLERFRDSIPQKYFVAEEKIIADTYEEERKKQYNPWGAGADGEGASEFDPYAQAENNEDGAEEMKDEEGVGDETCDITEELSCTKVDQSLYSEIAGIGVSVYGVAGYLLLIVLCVIALIQKPKLPNMTVAAIYCGAIFGFIFSLYLTWVEAFEIEAYCPYCLLSFAFMALILIAVMVQELVLDEKMITREKPEKLFFTN